MKILQIVNHFLPHQVAGTEVYTWALCKQLKKHGVEIEVVIPNYGATVTSTYFYDELKIIQFAEPSIVDRTLIMGKRLPDGLKAFRDYINTSKPDIIHFHELAGSNGITIHHVKAARDSGAKVIMTFHLASYSCRTGNLVYKEKELCDGKIDLYKCSSCYLHKSANPLLKAFLLPSSLLLHRVGVDTSNLNNSVGTGLGTVSLMDNFKSKFEKLIELCNKVVVITEWYKKILLLNGVVEDKICFISQGLPSEKRTDATHKNATVDYPIRLIFLGRINPFKGLHLLLEAILSLPENKIELDIFGQTGDDAYEQAWRKKTINNKNIHWKGKLQQHEVVSTLQNYDALCLCSTFSEMSPLVIQEAFAAGIPVIASNVYGNAEQIKHTVNGLLFQFKNVNSLKDELLRCINTPTLLGDLKKNIKPPKSFDTIGDEYFTLYKELISN